MKSSKPLIIVLCFSIILSYIYGMMTVQYKFFPYGQLKAIKHLFNSSVNAKQIIKPVVNAKQAAKPRANSILSHSDYFYHKKSFFDQHGGHAYDVVFIGDSITDEAEWSELFPWLKIANRGIAGDRTDGILKRMDSIYSTNAKKAFVLIGINDLFNGAEVNTVVENYHSIIRNLIAHRMQVYVQSTILAGKQKTQLNTKIKTLNEQLKKIADANQSVTYIDLNMVLAKDSFLNADYSRDGLHLNGDGYAVWKIIIENHLL